MAATQNCLDIARLNTSNFKKKIHMQNIKQSSKTLDTFIDYFSNNTGKLTIS